MLTQTRGVVLNSFKYSESSAIIKVYTEKFGLKSYILKGISSKNKRKQKICLQPLSFVDLNYSHRENKGLQNLKNIKLDTIYNTIPFQIHKSAIAFFLAEILNKVIKEEEPDEELFQFLFVSFIFFDQQLDNYFNFHLIFLLQLTKYFGVHPNINEGQQNIFFDIQNGEFKNIRPNHINYTDQETTEVIKSFLENNFDTTIKINNSERKQILSIIMDYYSIHVVNLSNIKSKEVLSEVFS